MAGLSDVKSIGLHIVGPVCGNRARALDERDISPMVHAYLLGAHAGVAREVPVKMGKATHFVDFAFGDKPYGTNRCVFELAVRGMEGISPLSISQNKAELRKLSRFPATRANGGRYLLLLDLHHNPIPQVRLQNQYEGFLLGRGKFARRSVSVVYVHRDVQYRFIWRA
jgi:hypothetical protein